MAHTFRTLRFSFRLLLQIHNVLTTDIVSLGTFQTCPSVVHTRPFGIFSGQNSSLFNALFFNKVLMYHRRDTIECLLCFLQVTFLL